MEMQQINRTIHDVEKRLDTKIVLLDTKIVLLDAKMDGVEKRLDTKMVLLDAKIDGVEKRLDTKMESVEKRQDAKMESVETRLNTSITEQATTLRRDMKNREVCNQPQRCVLSMPSTRDCLNFGPPYAGRTHFETIWGSHSSRYDSFFCPG